MKTRYVFALAIFVAVAIVTNVSRTSGGSKDSPEMRTPQVSSITDANGASVTNGSAGINPSLFRIRFNRPMDIDSVTRAGMIEITCGSRSPSQKTALAGDDNANGIHGDEYTLTIARPYKYQLKTCALHIDEKISSDENVALNEKLDYQFENDCALSDDFDANSEDCWTVGLANSGREVSSWYDLLSEGIFIFDSEISRLEYAGGKDKAGVIFKPVKVSPQGFEIILHLNSYSGLPEGGPSGEFAVGLANSDMTKSIRFDLSSLGQGFNSSRYLKLAASDKNISAEISEDGQSFDKLPYASRETEEGLAGMALLFFSFADTGGMGRAAIDSIIVTRGITAVGQY